MKKSVFLFLIVSSIAVAGQKGKEGQPCKTTEHESGLWVATHGDLKCEFKNGLSAKKSKPEAGEPCVTKQKASGKWTRVKKHLECLKN